MGRMYISIEHEPTSPQVSTTLCVCLTLALGGLALYGVESRWDSGLFSLYAFRRGAVPTAVGRKGRRGTRR